MQKCTFSCRYVGIVNRIIDFDNLFEKERKMDRDLIDAVMLPLTIIACVLGLLFAIYSIVDCSLNKDMQMAELNYHQVVYTKPNGFSHILWESNDPNQSVSGSIEKE